MAVQPTPDTLWQLRDILIFIGLLLAPVGYVLKKHLDDKRERFKNARLISQEQFDAGLPPNDADDPKPYQQAQLDRGFYLDIQQIKAKNWSERYTATLDKLQTMLANWFGEKLYFPAPKQQQNWRERQFGCDPFTVKSYEFCLKLALAYPLLFALVNFMFSGQLQIANMVFLSVDTVLERIWVIISFAVSIYTGLEMRQIDESKPWQHQLKQWAFIMVSFLAAILLMTASGAGVVAIAFAFAVAGAVAFAFAGAGAFAVAVAITGAIAFAFALMLFITHVEKK